MIYSKTKILQKSILLIRKIISILGLLLAIYLTFLLFKPLANEYLSSTRIIGGDYYNALTYAVHFSKHLPIPPSGWLSFWHEGRPIIGSYPVLPFYLMSPLTWGMETAQAMEIFSIGSLFLFLIASLVLFWLITKSVSFSLILTFILFITKATFYQLFSEGQVVAASTQWLLPVTLIFIHLYFRSKNFRYLAAGAVSSGLAILFHPAMGLLTVLLPSSVLLLVYLWKLKEVKVKISFFTFYLIVSLLIGSTTLYSLILQLFEGAGSGPCASPQCWGSYPEHLLIWFTPFTLIVTISLFFSVIAIQLIKKRRVELEPFFGPLLALFILTLYPLAAYLHLIDNLASAVFPKRIFWVLNLLLLLLAAHSYRLLSLSLPRLASRALPLISLTIIIFSLYTKPEIKNFDTANIFTVPAVVPTHIDTLIIPKYQTGKLSESDTVPTWIPLTDTNWRLDTFNPGLYQWWNVVSQLASVRGYSNNPVGVHYDWLYFFQTATRNVTATNEELTKNRALFLMDAYGVGFIENSLIPYPTLITEDPKIVINKDTYIDLGTTRLLKNLLWYQISPKVVTPVISPTDAQSLLFIGDEKGYNNFIRTIAMTNLNSRLIVPVKGPQSIDSLKPGELNQFKTLVLYRFKGNKWSKISDFVKGGGRVFIETGFLPEQFKGELAEIFPVSTIKVTETKGSWNPLSNNDSSVIRDIKLREFSPFLFEGGAWKLSTSSQSEIRPWAKVLLTHDNSVILAGGRYEKGYVIWSGINLPFHIVQNDNLEESRLFKNIIDALIEQTPAGTKPDFKVQRLVPEQISLEGKGFTGVYFKENYHPGWKAKVNGRDTKIYKAGPEFMYIPVLGKADEELKVSLSFVGSLGAWLLFYLTLISIILSLLYILVPQPFRLLRSKAIAVLQNKLGQRVINWWISD